MTKPQLQVMNLLSFGHATIAELDESFNNTIPRWSIKRVLNNLVAKGFVRWAYLHYFTIVEGRAVGHKGEVWGLTRHGANELIRRAK